MNEEKKNNYLEELNDAQRAAVVNTEGPSMIVAGAGSGKTRVITYRIIHLLNSGVDPFKILALTFTNKAAGEMKARISKLVGDSAARMLWAGTFHSIFARILRFEADKIGFPSSFTIYDSEDSKSLIKAIIREKNLDDKVYKPGTVYGRISSSKNNLINWAVYRDNAEIQAYDRSTRIPFIWEIFREYTNRCRAANAMDFDDLLMNTAILFRDFPDVLDKYQHRFRYIMVDEYQDTNYVQYLIVKKLAAKFENLCVVGDDAQSIYSFRGANIENILNFEKDYPDLKTFKLEQNYRSTPELVSAANSVIKKNQNQLRKEVWTGNDPGDKITVMRAFSDREEGELVAHAVFSERMNRNLEFKDFAILYRTNSQSRAMEEALRKSNIPYRIFGGITFYQRKEVKDLVAYFRLAINPDDEEAIKRTINFPVRGIGQATLERLIVAAAEKEVSLWKVLQTPLAYGATLGPGPLKKIEQFVLLLKSFAIMAQTKDAYAAANHIAIHSGILKEYGSDRSNEGILRMQNVETLLNGIKEFSVRDEVKQEDNESGDVRRLAEYLVDIALLTGDESDDKENPNKVSMMTVHAAKGLEFPVVFVVGMEENLFPSSMSVLERNDLEEERRLFYVALTRAEKKVYLSFATSRFRWGNLTHSEPSPFIDEIDAPFLDHQYRVREEPANPQIKTASGGFGLTAKSSSGKVAHEPPRKLRKLNENPASGNGGIDSSVNLAPDTIVEHPRFGKGVVLHLEGSFPNQKATIRFEEAGEKMLILKFAQLKILST